MRYIVDVREPHEFLEDRLEDAINIPVKHITREALELMRIEDEIIVYCRSGNRADIALQIFKQHGFHYVVNGINREHVENVYINKEI